MSRLVDWRPMAEAVATTVREKGYLADPLLYKAFAETPRHVFVPTVRDYSPPGRWITEADDDWLTGVYSDEPLVTQVKPEAGNPDAEWPTCSSSMPSLMADMIEELAIASGMDVLEVGTGTGYNAAILCHLLGDRHVTTIDVDPDLVGQARLALARLDLRPLFTPAGQAYDRVLATHAVTDIPYEWVRWAKPGAVILTDMRSQEHNETGAWAKLTVSDDGRSASGTLMPARGTFMGARRTPEFADAGYRPPPLSDEDRQQRAEQMRKRDSNLPPAVLEEPALGLLVWRAIPGVSWWAADDQYGLNAPDGSWANVLMGGTVVYGGPVDLWAKVEDTHAEWESAGRLDLDGLTITVTPDGQTRITLKPARAAPMMPIDPPPP